MLLTGSRSALLRQWLMGKSYLLHSQFKGQISRASAPLLFLLLAFLVCLFVFLLFFTFFVFFAFFGFLVFTDPLFFWTFEVPVSVGDVSCANATSENEIIKLSTVIRPSSLFVHLLSPIFDVFIYASNSFCISFTIWSLHNYINI